jgi:hypothetical protein
VRKKLQENWKSRRLRLLWLWAGAGGKGFCRIRQGFRLWRQVDWTGEERERERTPIRESGRPDFRVWVCWGEKGEMQRCGKGRRGYKE